MPTRRLSVPIERLSPELDELVSADQELEELGNGVLVAFTVPATKRVKHVWTNWTRYWSS